MSTDTSRLVTDNIGYVVTIAKQYAGRGVELDDLVSEGTLAMVEAAPKYDPTRGVSFVNYAAANVRRAIEHAIEQQAGLYRVPRSEASREEKKRKMPLSVDEPRPLGSKTSFTLLSVLENHDAVTADSQLEDAEAQTALQRKLARLDERQRNVVTSLYGLYGEETLTMAETAQKLGLRRERVRQVRDQALRKLRKA